MTREGKNEGARGGGPQERVADPAVEYLQQQRVRMMMMM